VGEGGGADHIELRAAERVSDRVGGAQAAVEALHELGAGFVINGPEGHEDRGGAGIEESPVQALDPLAPDEPAEGRLAGREADERGPHPEVVDLPDLDESVLGRGRIEGEDDRGAGRPLVVDEAVGGEVDDFVVAEGKRLERVLGGALAEKHVGAAGIEQGGDAPDLGGAEFQGKETEGGGGIEVFEGGEGAGCVGGAVVGVAESEEVFRGGGAACLGAEDDLTQGGERGGVGYGIILDEPGIAASSPGIAALAAARAAERLERQVVEDVVGDKDEALRLGREAGSGEQSEKVAAGAEVGSVLVADDFEIGRDFGLELLARRKGKDIQAIAVDDETIGVVFADRIGNERRAGGSERCLGFGEGDDFGVFQAGVGGIRGADLAFQLVVFVLDAGDVISSGGFLGGGEVRLEELLVEVFDLPGKAFLLAGQPVVDPLDEGHLGHLDAVEEGAGFGLFEVKEGLGVIALGGSGLVEPDQDVDEVVVSLDPFVGAQVAGLELFQGERGAGVFDHGNGVFVIG